MRKLRGTPAVMGGMLLLAVAMLPVRAFGLPGEADAVIAHCGQPSAENRDTSPVTGHMQRDLYYGNTILHFEPMESGWSFTTAWQGHLPISRAALEKRMPCFADAMNAVAKAPMQAIDPTIAAQTVDPAVISTNGFGVPFLWIVGALVVLLILLVAIPSARRKSIKKAIQPEDRPYRKPDLSESGFHRISASGTRHRIEPDRLDTDADDR